MISLDSCYSNKVKLLKFEVFRNRGSIKLFFCYSTNFYKFV